MYRYAIFMHKCRICSGSVEQFFDFGKQPLSDAFVSSLNSDDEFFFRLAVGMCEQCTMVQLMEEVPCTKMFHEEYPYRSSGSVTMRQHFSNTALKIIEKELTGPDPFIGEVGSNDGAMLRTINEQGIHHLGVEPSGGAAEMARTEGINVETAFFEKSSAVRIAGNHGPANVVYAANAMCHIPYMKSIFEGIDALLADDGVFVLEDPYLSNILRSISFDQIYDEHFYFFSVHSV